MTVDGQVDRAILSELIAAARPMTVGCHRAFDQVTDQSAALETLIDLGIAVVLTGGGAARALDGTTRCSQAFAATNGSGRLMAEAREKQERLRV